MALYPPVIESSMPAFNVNSLSVKINFDLSDYNTLEQIQQVHVTLRYQVNNANAFKQANDIYNDIYVINKNNISTEISDNGVLQYYITIPNTLLKDENGWKVNTLYKVQIRFSEIQASSISDLNNNLDKFSQWSTVCIIKPIYVPLFDVTNIEKQSDSDNFYITTNQFADFTMLYNPNNNGQTSTEILDKWKIQLYQGNNLLQTSDWQIVQSYNYAPKTSALNLSYSLPYEFSVSQDVYSDLYSLKFYIETKNGYKANKNYSLKYKQTNTDSFDGTSKIKTFINEEQGYIKIELHITDSDCKIILRRSNSKSKFLKWEDLKTIQHTQPSEQENVYTYYDFTAQSGIAYRYIVQKVANDGTRGVPLYDQAAKEDKATISEWEHAFLLQTAGDGSINKIKQLKLKFDLQISSFNINIAESKTETIGSKFPFIRRNGHMYYRSFPISGIITAYMDNSQLFSTRDELNNGYSSLYNTFNANISYYTTQYDFTYQRKFREAVEQFLYNIKPKLYKSMQEGNILIKLMDVSLSPKQQLNRLIYTFSATAYEIDQPTIQNYIKYNILKKAGV